jgi:hypothetical protein
VEHTVSDDELFDDLNAVPWDDIGRINQDGFVENEDLGDNPIFFDDQFEMRSRELQAAPPGMKTVNLFPSKQGPWSGNNQLGIQQLFSPDANNRQTILKLDEWGMPELWTLCLGLSFDINNWQPADPRSANFDITAIIQFGIGGVVQEVEIDWNNGTCITLPMNALNVIAQYNFSPDEGEGGAASEPPTDLLLRASLAHGSLTQAKPTRTHLIAIDAYPGFGFPQAFDIPPFATAVKIIPLTSSAFPDDLNAYPFYSQTGFIAFSTGVAHLTEGPIDWARFLTFYNLNQLVSSINFAESTCGAPVYIDIPTGARSIAFFNEVLGGNFALQYLIGV